MYMINNKQCILFLKFGKKKHLEEFQNGLIYMKETKYFIDYERTVGHHGMGDIYDSAIVQSNVPIFVNGIKLPNVDFIASRYDKDDKTPIFCCSYILKDDFIEESNNIFKLDFEKIQIEKYKKDFGEDVLVITSPEMFISDVRNACISKGLDMRCQAVGYVDYSSRDNTWIDLYKHDLSHFFIKDKNKFEWQKEFRFLIANRYTDASRDFFTIKTKKGFFKYSILVKTDDLRSLEYRRE